MQMWRKFLYSGFETCFGPSTQGAGTKTHLKSRFCAILTKFTPHFCRACQHRHAAHQKETARRTKRKQHDAPKGNKHNTTEGFKWVTRPRPYYKEGGLCIKHQLRWCRPSGCGCVVNSVVNVVIQYRAYTVCVTWCQPGTLCCWRGCNDSTVGIHGLCHMVPAGHTMLAGVVAMVTMLLAWLLWLLCCWRGCYGYYAAGVVATTPQ